MRTVQPTGGLSCHGEFLHGLHRHHSTAHLDTSPLEQARQSGVQKEAPFGDDTLVEAVAQRGTSHLQAPQSAGALAALMHSEVTHAAARWDTEHAGRTGTFSAPVFILPA